jgi:hypothetical protein
MNQSTRIRVSQDFAQLLEYKRRQMELASRKRMKMTEYTAFIAGKGRFFSNESLNRRIVVEIEKQRHSIGMLHPFTPPQRAKEGMR